MISGFEAKQIVGNQLLSAFPSATSSSCQSARGVSPPAPVIPSTVPVAMTTSTMLQQQQQWAHNQGQQRIAIRTTDLLGLGDIYKSFSSSPASSSAQTSSQEHSPKAPTPPQDIAKPIPGVMGCTSLSYMAASRPLSDPTRRIISALLSMNFLTSLETMNLSGREVKISVSEKHTPIYKLKYLSLHLSSLGETDNSLQQPKQQESRADGTHDQMATHSPTSQGNRRPQHTTRNSRFVNIFPQSELSKICSAIAPAKDGSSSNRSILVIYDNLSTASYKGIKAIEKLFRLIARACVAQHGQGFSSDLIPFASSDVLEKVSGVNHLLDVLPSTGVAGSTGSDKMFGGQTGSQGSLYIPSGIYGVSRDEFFKFVGKLMHLASNIATRNNVRPSEADYRIWMPMLGRFEVVDTADILNVIEYHQLLALNGLVASRSTSYATQAANDRPRPTIATGIHIANEIAGDGLEISYLNTATTTTTTTTSTASGIDASEGISKKIRKQIKKQLKQTKNEDTSNGTRARKVPLHEQSTPALPLSLANQATTSSFTKPRLADELPIGTNTPPSATANTTAAKIREFCSSTLFPRCFPFVHSITQDDKLLSLQCPLPHVPPNVYEHSRLSPNERKIIKATLIQHILGIGADSCVDIEAPCGDIHAVRADELSVMLVNTIQVDNIVELSGPDNLVNKFKILHSLLVPPNFLV